MENRRDELKLTEYHLEQNRRALESNKRMPKVTREQFKEQAQALRDFRRQSELEADKPKSKTEQVAQYFADLFKNALGTRLKARAEALEHRNTRLTKPDNSDATNK
jgi:hypothetical protein